MNKRKLYSKIVQSQKNVRYLDLVLIVEAFGFCCSRQEGSHRIYKRDGIQEFINLQNDNGKAKPYQIKQFLALVDKHNLNMEG
ncbi:MAG: type II toxin-antitoxin system HicA family toxin [Oscillospiraceae bacterium]|nr:type II toxin-antitoxin system HicA family toxin [Oscillospiraceae bacterium]